ncbi:MAG: hypothetical protein ABH816_00330 [Candidatus Levyibacteriota bacterium]
MKAFKKSDHESTLKAVIAFLILLVAFSIFILFKAYQDNIMSTNSLKSFVFVVAVGMAFLLGLLYLVNNQKISKTKKKR